MEFKYLQNYSKIFGGLTSCAPSLGTLKGKKVTKVKVTFPELPRLYQTPPVSGLLPTAAEVAPLGPASRPLLALADFSS